MRKNRVIEQNRCYHLVSRLAHWAFFLDDEEEDRAVALMRRVEAGVQASMSYCINRTVSISSDPMEYLAYVLCVGQADIYEVAVAIAGGDAFESAQDKYCVWIDCCPEVYLAPVPQFTMSEVVNGINNFIQTP